MHINYIILRVAIAGIVFSCYLCSMTVKPYNIALKPLWDDFVKSSRNGTFLFLRDYMDYHADRFEDCSLMAYDERETLVAMLPASVKDGVVTSHGGLTYGGWIMGYRHPDAVDMMHLWPAMMDYYRRLGYRQLIYKPVPHIYHQYPAEEDLYALWRFGGRLQSQLISTVTDLSAPLSVRARERKAIEHGITIEKSEDFESYWILLSNRLSEKYRTVPVHSLEEIKLLASKFPANIELYVAKNAGKICAGVVIFKSKPTIKFQYIASDDEGRKLQALPYIVKVLADKFTHDYQYLDYGPSNEESGRVLNEGLITSKCRYGGRGIVYSTYRIDL